MEPPSELAEDCLLREHGSSGQTETLSPKDSDFMLLSEKRSFGGC